MFHIDFESYTSTTYTEKYNIILLPAIPSVSSASGMPSLLRPSSGMDEGGVLIPRMNYVDTYMTELQRLFDEKTALPLTSPPWTANCKACPN
jgi:hypothetical protein